MEQRNFVLLVSGIPYGSESASLAYLFARAAVERHTVAAVFFYEDGVLNAQKFTSPASDETDLVSLWIRFAEVYGARLIICSSAGERRGVTPETLKKGFEIGALSDLAVLLAEGCRLVQFK